MLFRSVMGLSLVDYLELINEPNSKADIENMKVAPDGNIAGHFRLQISEISKSWLLIDQSPLPLGNENVQPIVIAHCRDIKFSTGNENIECERIGHIEDLKLSYHVDEENYEIYRKLDEYILRKLSQWKIP